MPLASICLQSHTGSLLTLSSALPSRIALVHVTTFHVCLHLLLCSFTPPLNPTLDSPISPLLRPPPLPTPQLPPTPPAFASLYQCFRQPLSMGNCMCCRYRPDMMSSSQGADSSSPGAGSQPQPPLVLCSVTASSRDTLVARLMQDYPSKFGYAVR